MKYTKEQITEAIAYWSDKLKMMNESLESLSKEQLKQKGTQAGISLAKYLNYKLIDKCIANGEDALDDNIIKEIISKIPSNVKEQIFSFLTQDVINDFCKQVEDENGNENLKYFIKTNYRSTFIEDLLYELIYASTVADYYENEDVRWQWNSYTSYMDFNDEIQNNDGVVQKVCIFCENFCNEYSREFFQKMNSADSTKEFKVTTLWYIPEMRDEVIEARDEDEVEKLITEKYKRFMNKHSETQAVYEQIWKVEEQ